MTHLDENLTDVMACKLTVIESFAQKSFFIDRSIFKIIITSFKHPMKEKTVLNLKRFLDSFVQIRS
jgi:hypothetical protein